MTDIKYVLKWLAVGLVGALWLHCASFQLPDHTSSHLYIIGTLTVACSIANLAIRFPKSSRTRQTAGGDSNQEGLEEVSEGDHVSAPAERRSNSVQGATAVAEPTRAVGQGDLQAEREALARMIEHHPDRWWSSQSIANDIRRGVHCHPECPECDLERPSKS